MNTKEFKNKERLIEAALEEFSNFSYNDSSLNRIIKKAEVSKGSFYFHFYNKQTLYLYVFDMAINAKKTFFKNSFKDLSLSKEGDIFELLKKQSKVGLEFSHKHPEYGKLAIMFYKEKGSRIYEIVKKRFSIGYELLLAPMLDEARKNGEFRDDLDYEFIKKIMVVFLLNFESILPSLTESNDLADIMNTFEKYVSFLKHGLANRRENKK